MTWVEDGHAQGLETSTASVLAPVVCCERDAERFADAIVEPPPTHQSPVSARFYRTREFLPLLIQAIASPSPKAVLRDNIGGLDRTRRHDLEVSLGPGHLVRERRRNQELVRGEAS